MFLVTQFSKEPSGLGSENAFEGFF